MTINEAVSEGTARGNDDRWGNSEEGIWVIDGCTSLGAPHFDKVTDAEWFADQLSAQLGSIAMRLGATKRALLEACREIRGRFWQATQVDPRNLGEEPAASFCLARVENGALALMNIGDCRVYWWSKASRQVRQFVTSNVTTFDAKVIARLMELQAERPMAPLSELWPLVASQIRCNRTKVNKPDGYYVARMTDDWIDEVQTLQVGLDAEVELLLCSDGFYRALDLYAICTPENLPQVLSHVGVGGVLRQIRGIEAGDLECRRFPRIKPLDDATAVWASVTQ